MTERTRAVAGRWIGEGHSSGRRVRHAALPADARGQQAATPDLRQAPDLLPPLVADAGRHQGDTRDLDARGLAQVRAAARRWLAVGAEPGVRRTAEARGAGPGLHHRAGLRRERVGRARTRGQHLLRSGFRPDLARGREPGERGDGLRLPRQGPGALRRRRVRARRQGRRPRREAEEPQVPLRGYGTLLLRQPGRGHSQQPRALGAGRARDNRRQRRVPQAGPAQGGDPRPRDGLAGHGDPRGPPAGYRLRQDDRGQAGPQDLLPRRDRLPHGVHRRRAGDPSGPAPQEEQLRPVPARDDRGRGTAPQRALLRRRAPAAREERSSPLNVTETRLPGVVVVEPRVFGDERGFFMETWNAARYEEAGLPTRFVQDNLSFSTGGVLRGLHFQNPDQQGKLVQVLDGEVFDVAVDIRAGSPTFGEWEGVILSSENKRQFYVPEGFAHGFLVTGAHALFSYKCTARYNPSAEGFVLWSDPEIGIEWPLEGTPTLSEKDRAARPLSEIPTGELPRYEP